MNNYSEKHETPLERVFTGRASQNRQQCYISDNRSTALTQTSLIRLMQAKPKRIIQMAEIEPDLSKGVNLNKGEYKGNADWDLWGTPITHSVHHIINFDSFLKPWFYDMTAAYVYSKSGDVSTKSQRDSARGRLKNIMFSVGIILDQGNISMTQQKYSWREGNLFIGIASEYRQDDPRNGNEWETTTRMSGSEIDTYIKEGETVYNAMKDTQNNISAIFNKGFDNSDEIRSRMTKTKCFRTDQRNWYENVDWTCDDKNHWGNKIKIYKLRNNMPSADLGLINNPVVYTNLDFNSPNSMFLWGCRYGDLKVNQFDQSSWTLTGIKNMIVERHIVSDDFIQARQAYNLDKGRYTSDSDPEVGQKLGTPFLYNDTIHKIV